MGGAEALAALALFGLAPVWAGTEAACRLGRGPAPPPQALPPISVLKPLCGAEPKLEEALASFCRQDYPVFELVAGVADSTDPALAVLAGLRQRFPKVEIKVVADPTRHGSNAKVSNLINLARVARYPLWVISDADIHAAPDFLRRAATALSQPGVGLVTALYAGLPADGSLSARLGASQITHVFLPAAALGRLLGRQDCFGVLMGIERATLDRVGGLTALADWLADDWRLGKLVRGVGLGVSLAASVPRTTVVENTLPALWRHELRWARTVRSLAPAGTAASVLAYPLAWGLLTLALAPARGWAWALFVLLFAARAAAALRLERALGLRSVLPFWLLPLREALSLVLLVVSFASDRVEWRGQAMLVDRPGASRP